MKMRLTRPLPQIGRVVPAGVVIDAPPGLYIRLLRENRAVPVNAPEMLSEAPLAADRREPVETVETPQRAVSGAKRSTAARKKVKQRG